MKVRVTRPCFIDSRLRTVGAEIDIRAELFSAACMKQLDSPEQPESSPTAQADPVSESPPAVDPAMKQLDSPEQPESSPTAQADPVSESPPAVDPAPSTPAKRRGRPPKRTE